jgi:hypothetical protein
METIVTKWVWIVYVRWQPNCAGFRYKGSKDIFFVDSYEIWQEGESIKGDVNAIIFNHIDSTILKG